MSAHVPSSEFGALRASALIGRCALYGALAWGTYAVLECAFVVMLPWLVQPAGWYFPLHFGVTAALFAVYPLIGSVATVMAGLALASVARRSRRVAALNGPMMISATACFTVAAGITVNLIAGMLVLKTAAVLLPAVAGALICAVIVATAGSGKAAWIANPWTAVSLLLVWTVMPQYIATSGVAVAVALCTAGVLLVSWIGNRMLARQGNWHSAPVQALTVVALAVALVAISLALDRGLYIRVPKRAASSAVAGGRPNVLLIVLDTVRADHTSVYGYGRDTTPNLKNLADQATVFDHAVATSDWTLPTHASIFTGVYASEHGIYCNAKNTFSGIPPGSRTTLAQELSRAGYSTAAIAANALLKELNLRQGFDYYSARLPAVMLNAIPHFSLRSGIIGLVARAVGHEPPKPYRYGGEISDEAIQVVQDIRRSGKPFFLFLNYMDAHTPYDPPPPYNRRYSASPAMPLADYNRLARDLMALRQELAAPVREDLIAQYDGAISYADEQIGRLLGLLKKENLFDNTLIVVTADHGESFGEHGNIGHGLSLYESEISIPLVIKLPGSREPRRVNAVAAGVDIMPTILDVVGTPVPGGLSGRSLVKPGMDARDFVMSENHACPGIMRIHPRFNRVEHAVRSGQWKFIESSAGSRELYNLAADPVEKKNMYGEDQQIAASMAGRLDDYRKRMRSSAARREKLSRDALETLKTLGYVQ